MPEPTPATAVTRTMAMYPQHFQVLQAVARSNGVGISAALRIVLSEYSRLHPELLAAPAPAADPRSAAEER